MRLASALLLCGLLLQTVAAAPPEITPIPSPTGKAWKEVEVVADDIVAYSAQPASTWEFVDETFKGFIFENGAAAAFKFPKGTHRVIITGPDKSTTRIKFIAGGDIVPPQPDPKPSDALVNELKTLYAAEPSPTKRADMQALSSLYTLMVTEAANPTYTSAAQLNATFTDARDRMLKGPTDSAPRLPTIRKRCGSEVAAVIGDNPDAALTDASRKAVAAVYQRLASAVGEASK